MAHATQEGQDSYVVATSQQTRFHLGSTRRSAEVDIKDLNVSIVSAKESARSKKSKSKDSTHELALLAGAELRLKAGKHYGLLGRNGTGKSTLLRAIAEKLIPGIPSDTRIAILQQTVSDESRSAEAVLPNSAGLSGNISKSLGKTVLQQVIESDATRNLTLEDLDVMSAANDVEDIPTQLRKYRQVRHNRMLRELLVLQNNASLRSGTRGLQARKDLLNFEKRVEDSKSSIDHHIEDLDSTEVQQELQDAFDLLQELQNQMALLSVVDVESKARNLLLGLGFEESAFQKPFNILSGGWRMRCMLAGVLIQDVEIMILDEPTNFLDLLSIIWLQEHLLEGRTDESKTVIIVSHDRDFVDDTCDELVFLRDQKLTYFQGNLSAYEKNFRSQVLYLTRMQEAQDREAARVSKSISATIKAGKKSGDDKKLRAAKSRQKKTEERSGMQVSATGGRFKLSRDRAGHHESKHDAIDIPTSERSISIVLPMAPDLRFPGPLISLEKVSYKYIPAGSFILHDVDLSVSVGDRVGIVGLNGSGKSTLIKLITDNAKPTRGSVTRHSRLRLGYYSQHAVEDLQAVGRQDLSQTALSIITTEAGDEMSEQDARGLLGSFGLRGQTASDVPIAKLSGGQLVRLALVRILWSHPNLLVLDEVTTHLDFDTVAALAEALADYNGAIIIVSHDRYLVRRVIEGVEVDDLGDEDEHEADEVAEAEERRRSVLILRGGRLKEQLMGVEGFQESLAKRVMKMAK